MAWKERFASRITVEGDSWWAALWRAARDLGPLVAIREYDALNASQVFISAHEARRPAIVTEGGLPPLISLACSDDVSDMKAATATLRGLSAAPEARRQIVLAGALDAFSLAAQCSEDVEVPREAAAALCALSLNEENKLDIAKSGIMGDLVMLAKMDDYLTVRQACGALANLSENKDTHNFLIGDADTVPVLCDLVNHRVAQLD